MNPNGYGGMCSRSILLERKEIDFEKGIETVATTEAPAMVVDWERWQIVREVLPMKYAVLPDNDKVPLLDSHSRFSIEMIKGSATGWRTDGKDLVAKVFVSKTEESVREKIKEGHIESVSIGYKTDREKTVEVPKGAKVLIDGDEYKNEFDDGLPMLVRTWWKTKELSLVPIGADDAAKFKSEGGMMDQKVLDQINELRKEIEELKKQNQKEPITGKSKALYERKLKRILCEINNN